MVTIVGYDDRDNTWILRNSYGSNWGNQGYFKIRRDDPRVIAEHFAYAPIV
jgi:C1A family cysteine protease